jgi:hypothetical protein
VRFAKPNKACTKVDVEVVSEDQDEPFVHKMSGALKEMHLFIQISGILKSPKGGICYSPARERWVRMPIRIPSPFQGRHWVSPREGACASW